MADSSFEISEIEQGKQIACPEYFDISVAQEFHQMLTGLLDEKPSNLDFDFADVEMIDTSILQTLCAFKNDAAQAGIQLHWKNTNEVICKSAILLGMDNYLDLECA